MTITVAVFHEPDNTNAPPVPFDKDPSIWAAAKCMLNVHAQPIIALDSDAAPIGYGFYPQLSRMKHSRHPSAFIRFVGVQVFVRALDEARNAGAVDWTQLTGADRIAKVTLADVMHAKNVADLARTSLQSELPLAWAVDADMLATVCQGCGKEDDTLDSCAKCGTIRYCSKECQVKGKR